MVGPSWNCNRVIDAKVVLEKLVPTRLLGNLMASSLSSFLFFLLSSFCLFVCFGTDGFIFHPRLACSHPFPWENWFLGFVIPLIGTTQKWASRWTKNLNCLNNKTLTSPNKKKVITLVHKFYVLVQVRNKWVHCLLHCIVQKQFGLPIFSPFLLSILILQVWMLLLCTLGRSANEMADKGAKEGVTSQCLFISYNYGSLWFCILFSLFSLARFLWVFAWSVCLSCVVFAFLIKFSPIQKMVGLEGSMFMKKNYFWQWHQEFGQN